MNHTGQHENKNLKIQGALIGITRGENSRNKFFLISHVVSEIEKELRQNLSFGKERNKNLPYIKSN